MEVILVEDEKLARENLEQLLQKIDPSIKILAHLDQVATTVNWLNNHRADLIFLDIHLADANSFSIFEQIEVATPIIFTTAYDQYAIQAFKVNSIDYLLKPIIEDELRQALEKFRAMLEPQFDWNALRHAISETPKANYQKRFLVRKGERLVSVKIEDIAYFEGEDRYVYLVKHDGQKYFIDHKLSDLEKMLNPDSFFRLNRSFIGHYEAIAGIISVSKSRVKVQLVPTPSRDIIVSTENTRLFKGWLNR